MKYGFTGSSNSIGLAEPQDVCPNKFTGDTDAGFLQTSATTLGGTNLWSCASKQDRIALLVGYKNLDSNSYVKSLALAVK